jgi:hypothetical protein
MNPNTGMGNPNLSNLPPIRIQLTNSQQAHLEVLKNIVKVLYDEKISYEIIKYIINLNGQPAEEEKMVNDLNLRFDAVRQSLTRMGNDGILISREYKKKKEKDEEDENLYTPGLSNQGQRRPINKKINTLEWKINDTYYNIIKQRFEELKLKLKQTLEYKAKDKFECTKCKRVYELDQVAHIGYVCKQCEERPKLSEIKAEDVSLLRIQCNEIIQMLTEEFNKAEKSGSGFHYAQKPVVRTHHQREKKTVNNLQLLSKGNKELANKIEMSMINPNEIYVPNELEDPEIEEVYGQVKRDESKLKRLKDIMELYIMYK